MRRVGLAVVLCAAGCGRSDIGFDNGCPKDQPHCDQRDLAGADSAGRDGPIFDGGPDGGLRDGGRDNGIPDGFVGDGFNRDGLGGDGFNRDGFFGDGFNRDGFGGDGFSGDGFGGDGFGGDGFGGDGFGGDGGCGKTEICGNGIDDDCNGLRDCFDPACQATPSCIDQKKEICNNGLDDDGNGLVDCKDPQCFGDPSCLVLGKEICNNGIDDNDDGLIDCADPQCMNQPICMPQMGQEICDNGVDDNGDGLVDCVDPQCKAFPACLTAACKPDVDFGAIAAHDASVSRAMNTVGATQAFATCAAPGGTARVGSFTLAAQADVKLDFTQVMGSAHVVSVYRAGVLQACDQNLVFCLQAGQQPTATHTFAALAAGSYWVIVQSYPGTQGSTSVTLSTGSSKTPEICNNGVDDDGNGLIDCADLACKNDPNCTGSECTPDINLGALVVDGPAASATFDTNLSQNRYHPTCAGTSTGKDEVVRFTLKETAGILVQWTQTGDHVFGLFETPPPGAACDALQSSCYYPGGAGSGAVAWSARPPGDYLFIFKPIQAGAEGVLHIQVSAYKNRQIEICNNGIDDDGNGLIDCNDPACFGVGNCKAPLCMPDVDLGDFTFGTQKQVVLDTTTGIDLYKTKCGKGNGKEKVVRLTLDQEMALGFSCTETGDAVLQLDQQVNPLDQCDANLLTCADPKILPFGCNFAMPNLQPGHYNLIVSAFQAGTEGTVNLTLFGIQEKTLEICDNGIDDDGDGFIDCADLKCVTSPLCAKFACRADQKLGLLPLNDTPTAAVVQTTNGGDDQTTTPCVTAAGGQDAVIDFELPAVADLTIDWAQVGNHDFALYQDASDLLACDAGPLVVCTSSGGNATGMIPLTKVPKGKYHLVIDADAPGKEGGVVVQLSGHPSP